MGYLIINVSEKIAATLTVKLDVQNENFYNGPENMGIGLVIINFDKGANHKLRHRNLTYN